MFRRARRKRSRPARVSAPPGISTRKASAPPGISTLKARGKHAGSTREARGKHTREARAPPGISTSTRGNVPCDALRLAITDQCTPRAMRLQYDCSCHGCHDCHDCHDCYGCHDCYDCHDCFPVRILTENSHIDDIDLIPQFNQIANVRGSLTDFRMTF
jgi:hypothetical protein